MSHPFTHVTREPSLADKVAGEITEAIVARRLMPGQQLDSERELADQFGVSRTVIREAVRSLAAQGLIETKSGRGIHVAEIDGDTVTRSMNLYLRRNPGIDYRLIHEVRTTLEIEIAGLAAERATTADIDRLARLNVALMSAKTVAAASELDVQFHLGLGAATQNQLYRILLESIGEILLEIRRAAFANRRMIDYAASAHGEILECVETHDGEGAREAMSRHLSDAQLVWSDESC
jgi:GntR family transcriptional regulator, transcriptional repressor for pyruvate dehydrogenase complex